MAATRVDDIRQERYRFGALVIKDASGFHTHTRFRILSEQQIPVLKVNGEIYAMKDCGAASGEDKRAGWAELVLPAHKAPIDARYSYGFLRPDGERVFIPDFMAFELPDGIEGDSAVVDIPTPRTIPGWKGIARHKRSYYSMHLGTHTPQGTLLSLADQIDYIKSLGFNTVELLPIGSWKGGVGWGYDITHHTAVNRIYGKLSHVSLIADLCHDKGMALDLNIIPNHLGPGEHLHEFAPEFFNADKTQWGDAPNYDHPDWRYYIVQTALMYLDMGIDGVRVDAAHAVIDHSKVHILKEMHDQMHDTAAEQGREIVVIHENQYDKNIVRTGEPDRPRVMADGAWMDGISHAACTAIGGEVMNQSYYRPLFRGGQEKGPSRSVYPKKAFAEAIKRGGFQVALGDPNRRVGMEKVLDKLPYDPVSAVNGVMTHDQQGNRPDGRAFEHFLWQDEQYGLKKLCLYVAVLGLQPSQLLFWAQYGRNLPFPFFSDMPGMETVIAQGRLREMIVGMEYDPAYVFDKAITPSDIPNSYTAARAFNQAGEMIAPIHPAIEDTVRKVNAYREEFIIPGMDPEKPGQVYAPTLMANNSDEGGFASWRLRGGMRHSFAWNFSNKAISVPQLQTKLEPWSYAAHPGKLPVQRLTAPNWHIVRQAARPRVSH